MAPPRTKGPNIQFRLPLELHAVLEKLAAAKGQTPTEWVRAKVSEALSKAGS